jgi:hemerythrin
MKSLAEMFSHYRKKNEKTTAQHTHDANMRRVDDINTALKRTVSETKNAATSLILKMECELTAIRKKINVISTTISDSLISMDYYGNIISINQFAEQMFGYTEAEVIGRNVEIFFDVKPGECQNIKCSSCNLCLNALRSKGIIKLVKKNGAHILTETSFNILDSDETEETSNTFICIIHDVTYREEIRNEINKHVMFQMSLFSSVPNAIFWKNKNGVYQGCNDKFTEYTGIDEYDLIGKRSHEIFNEEFALNDEEHDLHLHLNAVNADKDTTRLKYETKLVNGKTTEERDVRVYKTLIHDAITGGCGGMIGTMFDITELKSIQSKLQTQVKCNSQLQNALNGSSDPLMIFNNDHIFFVNEAFCNIFRCPMDEIIGTSIMSLSVETLSDVDHFEDMWNVITQNKKWNGKNNFRTKDTLIPNLELTIIPIMNGKPRPIYYIAIFKQGNNQPFASWNDAYSCGHDEIDSQHKEFFDKINKLHQCMLDDECDPLPLLDDLIQHTLYHFEYEEKIMDEIRYCDIEKHKKQHQKLVIKLESFKDSTYVNTRIELFEFLITTWLMKHLLVDDRRLNDAIEAVKLSSV